MLLQAAEAGAASSGGAHVLWGDKRTVPAALQLLSVPAAGPQQMNFKDPEFHRALKVTTQHNRKLCLCRTRSCSTRKSSYLDTCRHCASPMQVSINMLRYGLGRSQSVPLQLGLAAAIRAAATASPATAVAAVDFMRYTESHLAEALAERHSSSADRCTLGQYCTWSNIPQASAVATSL